MRDETFNLHTEIFRAIYHQSFNSHFYLDKLAAPILPITKESLAVTGKHKQAMYDVR